MKIAAIGLLWAIGTAAYADEQIDITKYTAEQAAELATKLLDYGMWRQEQDRTSFPIDFPKQDEPYDPLTGNALHNVSIVPLANLAPRPVVTEKIIPPPAPVAQVAPESVTEPDICQGRGKRSYRQHGRQTWRCRR